MIICNLWLPDGHEFGEGEYELHIAAVVNDAYDIRDDGQLIVDCLENHEFDTPIKPDTLYELSFDRASIEAPHPAFDPAFAITNVRERKVHEGQFTDLVQL